MAANIESLARQLEEQYPGVASLLRDAATVARKLGVPERFGSDPLRKAIAELEKTPFSPEAVTNFWRAKLRADGERIRLDIPVPNCDWTEEEIRKPMIDINGNEIPSMMVYVPDQLTGQEGLVRLGRMYPEMQSRAVQKGTTVQDSPDANKKGGWIKVEATVDAPNLDTTLENLKTHAGARGYSRQRLIAYVLASQASKDLTGQYLDEVSTWSRLGSRDEGDTVHARFYSDGRLYVGWLLNPQDHDPRMGGRFEEVKKKA